MSKKIKSVLSLFFAIILMMPFCITVNAADNDLTINSDVQAKVGDKVKCAIYMSDCTQKVIGIDMTIFFDKEKLKLDADSITYQKFDGAVQNAKLDGYFKFNWTQINDEQDFSKKGLLVSAEFEVIKGGTTEISHFITDLYDYDLNNIDPYKITYDISVNDEVAAKDKPPVINQDHSNEKKLQGSFTNYLDGMGDKNTDSKGDHQAFIADQKYISQEIQTEIVDATKFVSADGTGSSFFKPTTIVIIVAVVIVVLAIVAVIIVKNKDDKKNTDNK